MKKGVFIAVGVVALLAVMVWADHKFPAAGVPSASAPAKPTDAPTVSRDQLNDNDVSVAQYKGKEAVVNFWLTWCEPCKVEIPWMIEFQETYSPRGFTIF